MENKSGSKVRDTFCGRSKLFIFKPCAEAKWKAGIMKTDTHHIYPTKIGSVASEPFDGGAMTYDFCDIPDKGVVPGSLTLYNTQSIKARLLKMVEEVLS